jgi:hypothetical protein
VGAVAGSGFGKDTAATPIIVCLLLPPCAAGGRPDAGKLDTIGEAAATGGGAPALMPALMPALIEGIGTIGGPLGRAADAGGASAVGLVNPNIVACEAFAIDAAISGSYSVAEPPGAAAPAAPADSPPPGAACATLAGVASGAKTAPQRLQKRPSGGNG